MIEFPQLARYNAWANQRLFAVVGTLPAEQFVAPCGLFFGSICGTLNHILVADRMWHARITGDPLRVAGRLDEILFDRFEALAEARAEEDARLTTVVEGLSSERIAAPLTFRTYAGQEYSQPLWQVLSHIFNHQTHHRGQVHAGLTQMGREVPPLDFIYFCREA